MGVGDATTLAHLLKTAYLPEYQQRALAAVSPLFGMLNKGEITAQYERWPVEHSPSGRRSRNPAVALANKQSSRGNQFQFSPYRDFAAGAIDGMLADLASKDSASFEVAVRHEVESTLSRAVRQMAKDIFGTGSGSIGTIQSIDTLKIYVTTVSALSTVFVGDRIVAAAGATSALWSVGTTPTATVTSVIRTAAPGSYPYFTVDAVPSGWAASSLLWHEGDYEAASDAKAFPGLNGWFPATLEAGTFGGVTRSVDRMAYAGHAINLTTYPLIEGLSHLLTSITSFAQGPCVDVIIVSPTRHEQIRNSLPYKERTITLPAQMLVEGRGSQQISEIGYEGLAIPHGRGVAALIADVNCDDTDVWPLTRSSLEFRSVGTAPRFLNRNGTGEFQVEVSDDAIGFRIGAYGYLKCTSPHLNGHGYNFGA